jgi:predicted ABC-type transport system involved in lysophospholipase L1 biosynthesis ATPase subunit
VCQDFNLVPAVTAAEDVALPHELDGARAFVATAEASSFSCRSSPHSSWG